MKNFIIMASMAVLAVSTVAADELDSVAGRALFKRQWLPAPSSTIASDGLGPLFNARSCEACHAGGGPALATAGAGRKRSIKGSVVRFGDAKGRPDPYYGQQLQTGAVPGLESEGSARGSYPLDFDLSGPPLADGVKAGARIAPSLAGRAAFDDIADDEILKLAEAQKNADGPVKGIARRLGPDGASGPVGRFGWKASHATLENQIANAFALDMGLSSPLDPRPYGDCTPQQTACLAAPHGESESFDGREVSSQMLVLVAAYLKTLQAAAPDENEDGKVVFEKTGCAACHVPKMTGKSGQAVATYSDFLLHDMGPDLDDGVGEANVPSSRWRTAPLLDMTTRDNKRRYLHDGRAATLDQAIAAHGGEAEAARQSYEALDIDEKRQLIGFLKHL